MTWLTKEGARQLLEAYYPDAASRTFTAGEVIGLMRATVAGIEDGPAEYDVEKEVTAIRNTTGDTK
jgi:hypothetical protein